MKKIIAGLILPVLLCACGFHLRGAIDVPKWLDNVYIMDQSKNKELDATLETYFKAYHIKLSNNPDRAKYWLVIEHVNQSQQISSVGTGSNPRQYLLIYSVDFHLQDAKGKMVKPLNHVEVTRQLTVNNDRILGSNEEAGLLASEMQKDAAMQIINRLSRQ